MEADTRAGLPVYVVSGLPRSGTSMMMRMLIDGGLPAMVDDARIADDDNPRGYFELEAVKRSATDVSWASAAGGKVVKVISYLLPYLPVDQTYRVVFLRRELDHVVRSQRAMLERLGSGAAAGGDEEARRLLAEHLVEVETWFEQAHHVQRLGVSYERVLRSLRPEADRIARFLDVGLDVDAMIRAVEPELRRQR